MPSSPRAARAPTSTPTCWRSPPRTAALPTPARPRDYQLTADDARRLGRGGIRGWLDRIGSPKDRLSRPLAVGLTTLGLVGVLVGTAPSLLPSSGATSAGTAASAAASAPSQERIGKTADGQASAAPSAAAAPGVAAPAPSAAASAAAAIDATTQPDVASQAPLAAPSGRLQDQGTGASRDLNAEGSGGIDQGVTQPELAAPPSGANAFETLTSSPSSDGGPSLVLIVSVAALLGGIALFALRFGARRRGV